MEEAKAAAAQAAQNGDRKRTLTGLPQIGAKTATISPERPFQIDDGSSQPATLSKLKTAFTLTASALTESNLSDSQKIAVELREQRRKKTVGASDKHMRKFAGNASQLPTEAYGSACPAAQVCLGMDMKALPVPQECKEHIYFQHTCGNTTDVATRTARSRSGGVQDVKIEPGQMVGFPEFEGSGWSAVERSEVLMELNPDEEMCWFLTCKAFGIQKVSNPGVMFGEGSMVTFRKSEIPGTTKEILELVRKLKKVDHSNVMKLLYAYESEDEIFMIYEDCKGAGKLPMEVLYQQGQLASKQCARLCQQLAAAVNYCHNLGMGHLDWSIWNIFSSSYAKVFPVKIFGIGLAGCLHSGRYSSVPDAEWLSKGTFYYLSPELCRIKIDPDVKAPYKKLDPAMRQPTDVWAIAAIMYVALTGYPPFGGPDERTVMEKIMGKKLILDGEFARVENEGCALLEKMMSKEPKARPTAMSLITYPWVMSAVQTSNKNIDFTKVVDRMKAFSDMKPVMRVIGQMLMKVLHQEKLALLEQAFAGMDLRGDGEVEVAEVQAICYERRDEIKEIFQLIDVNRSGKLSCHEFCIANIYGDDILSERMLKTAFDQLDQDGSGQITAGELYGALRGVSSELTPEEVVDFMGDADKDFDEDMDFDEFRGFFPFVKSRSTEVAQRRQKSDVLLEVCSQTFVTLEKEYEHWKASVLEEMEKANVIGLDLEDPPPVLNHHESNELVKAQQHELTSAMKKVQFLIKSPPAMSLPEGGMEKIKANSDFYLAKKNKRKLRSDVIVTETGDDEDGGAKEEIEGGATVLTRTVERKKRSKVAQLS
eukprot:gnl/TRDRNA2_/TRDRNA2_172181_c0_seq5.p1 gnl/TRDRNA2_/TRDRNA2_172181_c0~~gnl/TRDRNA2_/TRDRNA2_172181_c0_seq5.p1  ORF type:complete len:821 (+),score=203.48 gnl/TRDRNA2_/TRDRNA2_172181_c0_seq5:184-2646(+)